MITFRVTATTTRLEPWCGDEVKIWDDDNLIAVIYPTDNGIRIVKNCEADRPKKTILINLRR